MCEVADPDVRRAYEVCNSPVLNKLVSAVQSSFLRFVSAVVRVSQCSRESPQARVSAKRQGLRHPCGGCRDRCAVPHSHFLYPVQVLIPHAGKADIWRLAIIERYGGIYVDSDVKASVPNLILPARLTGTTASNCSPRES